MSGEELGYEFMAKAKAKDKDGDESQLSIKFMSWKEVTAVVSFVSIIAGLLTSLVAWVHADFMIPKILQRTSEQVEKRIRDHASVTHVDGATKEELRLIERTIRSDVQGVENQIEEFKEDSRQRLNRIEDKLDRM